LTFVGLVIGLVLTPPAAQLLTALLYGFQPRYATAAVTVATRCYLEPKKTSRG
jgi:hypothetical protein